MKKVLKIVLAVIGILLIAGLLYCWQGGLFDKVVVTESSQGGFMTAGKEFKGPYSNAGKFIRQVEDQLKPLAVKYERTFGIYYDNPSTTPAENCRSYIGIILENTDSDQQNLLKSAGFKLDSIPLKSSIVSHVDIRNSLSYMIGPFKVYPKFNEYLKEKNYRVSLSMEIYDVKAEKITLFMQYDNSVN